MAARFSSSASILRPALAAHVSLSAASLLCSAFGPSQLPVATAPSSSNNLQQMASVCAALPWLDQLHNMVASMYVSGGISNRCAGLQQHNVMVQIGKDVSFENPVVSYAGVGEIDRAFRGRSFLHPQNDFKTVLECINVEASEDSICGGGDATDHSLVGIPSTINASAPPKVKVTYKLSQQYGTFSVNSLLVVTIQVRRGCPSTKIRKITPKKVGVPLATSGFTPRAASAVAVAATAHSGPASVALVKAASEIVAATKRLHSNAGHSPNGAAVPLVAEVVRIEEQWNGVQLLHFAPFHWSRRLNGLVAGSAAYFFFN